MARTHSGQGGGGGREDVTDVKKKIISPLGIKRKGRVGCGSVTPSFHVMVKLSIMS